MAPQERVLRMRTSRVPCRRSMVGSVRLVRIASFHSQCEGNTGDMSSDELSGRCDYLSELCSLAGVTSCRCALRAIFRTDESHEAIIIAPVLANRIAGQFRRLIRIPNRILTGGPNVGPPLPFGLVVGDPWQS